MLIFIFIIIIIVMMDSNNHVFLALVSPKKVIYEFEGVGANSGECQSCLTYYRQQDGKDSGYFRFVLAQSVEIGPVSSSSSSSIRR